MLIERKMLKIPTRKTCFYKFHKDPTDHYNILSVCIYSDSEGKDKHYIETFHIHHLGQGCQVPRSRLPCSQVKAASFPGQGCQIPRFPGQGCQVPRSRLPGFQTRLPV